MRLDLQEAQWGGSTYEGWRGERVEVRELSWDWAAGLTPGRRGIEEKRAGEFAAALKKSWPGNREPPEQGLSNRGSCNGEGWPRLCLRAAQLLVNCFAADSQLRCLQQQLSGRENWMVHSHNCQLYREFFSPSNAQEKKKTKPPKSCWGILTDFRLLLKPNLQ